MCFRFLALSGDRDQGSRFHPPCITLQCPPVHSLTGSLDISNFRSGCLNAFQRWHDETAGHATQRDRRRPACSIPLGLQPSALIEQLQEADIVSVWRNPSRFDQSMNLACLPHSQPSDGSFNFVLAPGCPPPTRPNDPIDDPASRNCLCGSWDNPSPVVCAPWKPRPPTGKIIRSQLPIKNLGVQQSPPTVQPSSRREGCTLTLPETGVMTRCHNNWSTSPTALSFSLISRHWGPFFFFSSPPIFPAPNGVGTTNRALTSEMTASRPQGSGMPRDRNTTTSWT